jgi:DNA helicase-2/ATP-dependent DNA helicase PcrA
VGSSIESTVGLTAAQRDAVVADDPVLCVLAGAGTGKTRVLTLRVARRAGDRSARADRVLVCTFSRKAADELRRRLWSLGVGDVRAGTFHRTALGLLRQYRADRGGPAPSVLPDRRALLADVLADPVGGGGARRRPDGRRLPRVVQVDGEISWAKARLIGPESYEEEARRHHRRPAAGTAKMADLYGRYEAARHRQGALDFDDLLWRAADVLAEDPTFAAAVRWRNHHVFVDEMQDVNPAQFRFLRLLVGDDPDLFVVGDPNQSVYGWNGADPSLLDRLPATFPGTRVLRLDENHRCSPQVVAVASAALGLSGATSPTSSRPDGVVPRVTEHATDADEAQWVARQVWTAHRPGRRWAELAVLARTNGQLAALTEALSTERVPYRLAGGSLGPASDLRARRTASGALAVQPVDDRDGHDEPVSDGSGSTGFGSTGEADEDADAVTLTTFHRAKGLQWPAVFVVGLSDGLVPIASARSSGPLDEERRLLYVALTRAEIELTCSWARHVDARSAADGVPSRSASPWLGDVVRTCRELDTDAAPADPDQVVARLAELRTRLGAVDPAAG